jgi:hypothetical protein
MVLLFLTMCVCVCVLPKFSKKFIINYNEIYSLKALTRNWLHSYKLVAFHQDNVIQTKTCYVLRFLGVKNKFPRHMI